MNGLHAAPVESVGFEGTDRATRLARQVEYLLHTVRWFERFLDFSTILISLFTSYFLYATLHLGKHVLYSTAQLRWPGTIFAGVFVILLDHDGGYHSAGSLMRIRETERILRTVFLTFMLVFAVSFFMQRPISRWMITISAVITAIFLIFQKQMTSATLSMLHSRGYALQRVALYGAGEAGKRVLSALQRSPKMGMSPVICFDDESEIVGDRLYEAGYRRQFSIPIIAGPPTAQAMRDFKVDMLILTGSSLPTEELTRLQELLKHEGVVLASVPNNIYPADTSGIYADLDGVLISTLDIVRQDSLYFVSKRFVDFLLACALLVVLAPFMIVIAIAVKLESEGPAFFRQTRIGRSGKPFTILKFRSMYARSPVYASSPMESQDRRITKLGRFLRRTSLDELPQIVNVLLGDMSFVGPRPEMPFIVEQYQAKERKRLQVTPGITGLWQLSADRAFHIHENMDYDLYYIRYQNFFMDLAVLVHTMLFAMRGV